MSSKRNIKKFIILTSGRTGSTAIVKWLNSSPHIRCHNEVFLPYDDSSIDCFGYYISKVKKSPILYKYGLHRRFAGIEKNPISVSLVKTFMNDLFYSKDFSAPWEKLSNKGEFTPNANFEAEKLVGYKVGYGHYDALYGARKWIRENDVYVIHLFRKNLLKKHISKLVADKTSVWHSQDKVNKAKLSIDIQDVIQKIEKTEEKDAKITQELNYYNKPVLPIFYEDFLDMENRENFSRQFAEFFEEDNSLFTNLSTSLKKLNSNKLEDLLENYDEVHVAFSNSKYSSFLQD